MNNLNQFLRAQKDELKGNRMQFMSQEEKESIAKAKQKVKLHFLKFFRTNLIKKNRLFFNKWKSYVEFEHYREHEFAGFRVFIIKKKKFAKKLTDEKSKQKSKILLNGFKSLN